MVILKNFLIWRKKNFSIKVSRYNFSPLHSEKPLDMTLRHCCQFEWISFSIKKKFVSRTVTKYVSIQFPSISFRKITRHDIATLLSVRVNFFFKKKKFVSRTVTKYVSIQFLSIAFRKTTRHDIAKLLSVRVDFFFNKKEICIETHCIPKKHSI